MNTEAWSSLVAVESRTLFFGPSVKHYTWTLKGNVLTMSTSRQGIQRTVHVKQGFAWPNKEFGFQVETDKGEWIRAVAISKRDWAMWIHALHAMHPNPKEESPLSKKVNFHGKVRIRSIPKLSQDEISKLYYSDKEIDKMAREVSSKDGLLVAKRRLAAFAV
ncbi:hypothetical protein LEN26_002574 [Aphanomyces euteiches]|nr:hypothetical protein AeMF1_006967 [Aphanomyces euteiches]KAH9159027.1 hypothetical protein LEN26_002574 [Aphanomyces euteiches]KAH9182452.1 hypothetical protein AeNC1_015570 [Aphanomyces euteiches]